MQKWNLYTWAISSDIGNELFQKISKQEGGWGHGFPGVLKKNHVEIPGVNWKRRGISRGFTKFCENFFQKLMWNFHGSRLLTSEFPRGGHTVLQNFQGWKLVFSRIFKAKVTNLRTLGRFSEKHILKLLVWIFFVIAQFTYCHSFCILKILPNDGSSINIKKRNTNLWRL